MNFVSNFNSKGYTHIEQVFKPDFISELRIEFDRIVDQLKASDENINARWGSKLTQNIEDDESVVNHTHNV